MGSYFSNHIDQSFFYHSRSYIKDTNVFGILLTFIIAIRYQERYSEFAYGNISILWNKEVLLYFHTRKLPVKK